MVFMHTRTMLKGIKFGKDGRKRRKHRLREEENLRQEESHIHEVDTSERVKSPVVVEGPAPQPEGQKLERDSWMVRPPPRPARGEQHPEDEKEKKEEINLKELNPYYANGGNGIPTEEQTKREREEGSVKSYPVCESWKKRALTRAKEMAQETDQSVEDYVKDRWGALDSLFSGSVGKETKKHEKSFSEKKQKEETIRRKETNEEIRKTTVRVGESDLNKLTARLLRAEMKGDTAMCESLKKQIEKLKSGGHVDNDEEEIVILDSKRKRSSRDDEDHSKRRRKHDFRLDEKGERVRYFRNEDVDASLDSLVKDERLGISAVDEMDGHYAQRVLKNPEFKGLDAEDEYGDESNLKLFDDGRKASESVERDNKRALKEYKKTKLAHEKCHLCMKGRYFQKHLMVALGEKVMLCLPDSGYLDPMQCILVPIEHRRSMTDVDEEVYAELKEFERCLVRMYRSMGMDVVFMETVRELEKQRHTYVDCIPLNEDAGELAPMYFKKGLSESEKEWSQHKKVIDTSGKGIKRSIPNNFAYFHVEFGLNTGFAHVIEDDDRFPSQFGREIVSGMLGLPSQVAVRRKRDSWQEERNRVKTFLLAFGPFDFTTKYEGGEL